MKKEEIEALVAEVRARHARLVISGSMARGDPPTKTVAVCEYCWTSSSRKKIGLVVVTWPCDAIRLADALEAVWKEQRTLGLAWEPGSCVMEDDGCAILDLYHDAARAAQGEK